MPDQLKKTPKTRVRRLPERGSYDRKLAYAILDEGVICHVACCVDGQPVVIPMAYARDADRLLLHGSVASRLMKTLAEGTDVSVAVTHVDGLVLARSVFHHSMNYRSVVLFGRTRLIDEEPEKTRALERLVEHLVPGRSADARPPNRKEAGATTIVEMPIEEASVKSRSGPPGDNVADLDLSVWAGLVPVNVDFGNPQPAPDLGEETPLPAYLNPYSRD